MDSDAADLTAHPPTKSTRNWNPAFLSATAAVVIPATAAVHGAFEKNRDVEVQGMRLQNELLLQREQQVHEARLAYLGQMRDPESQARVLRFVIASAPDAQVRAWAADELQRAQANARAQQRAQARLKTEAEHAWSEAMAATSDARQRAALKQELARRQSRLAEQGCSEPTVGEGLTFAGTAE